MSIAFMSAEDKDPLIFKVSLLFERIKEGKVKFVEDKVPEMIAAL